MVTFTEEEITEIIRNDIARIRGAIQAVPPALRATALVTALAEECHAGGVSEALAVATFTTAAHSAYMRLNLPPKSDA